MPAKALVSRIDSGDMLIAQVLLAGHITTAHLDSCATHCFVSSVTSKELCARGYFAERSRTSFDVEQGNPLCNTNTVHYLPLSMVKENGTLCSWDDCLFLVADAGAPVIICNTLLRLGGIVRYNPPEDYVRALERNQSIRPDCQGKTPHPAGSADAPMGRRPTGTAGNLYLAPSRTTQILRTETVPVVDWESENRKLVPEIATTEVENLKFCNFSRELDDEPSMTGVSNYVDITNDLESKRPRYTKVLVAGAAEQKKVKRKGETDMLTADNPYGKNPPLNDEVMEALRHLKKLAEPSSVAYTDKQMEEIRVVLGQNRPKWANSLAIQHTLEVADKETEKFINEMMDQQKYKSVFSSDMRQCCDLGEYELNQMEGRDQWTPPQPRRFKNPNTTKIVDDWLDTLLENNKCRESNATHPAVVTVVEKEGRDPRVCVDYRNRNARTLVPVFPMPDVQEFLDDNAGFRYYCSFDMAKMFTQFKIKEAHKSLAAFITHRGVYEPNAVMFGLAGGPQHAVRECGGAMAADPLTNGKDFTIWALKQNENGVNPPYVLDPSTGVIKGSRLRPFIDDITTPSNHLEGMKKIVELLFNFCEKHHLILSKKKAKIMRKYLCMLGFVVSEEGKHLDPHRIIKLLEAKTPRSRETLHALLSSYTFVRMFIPNFASIASPLYEATRGIIWKGPKSGKSLGIKTEDPSFAWTPQMTRAYDQLRNALLEAPILVQVNNAYPLFLSVDASIRGEGWVLWQLITIKGVNVAVAILYGSRKYSDTERNWETTRQEASAIRTALTDVYEYVFGRHFYLFSDHLNLRFMHNSINRAVLRMRDFLSQFNMTVVHCPGIWNNADSMSRIEQENLPVEAASDLNSSTSAVLEGTSLKISIGTSTHEDLLSEGCSKLQPKSSDNISPLELRAVTLCTRISESQHFCLLCQCRENDWDDYSAEEHEGSITHCLNTQSEVTPDNWTEWKAVIEYLPQTRNMPADILYKEAIQWNLRMQAQNKPVISENFEDLAKPNQRDNLDYQDLEWCGTIHRTTTVLMSAVARRFVPSSTMPPTRPATELSEFQTQTTPADFRMVNVRFPMKDDYLAIHNNESGHHGLDYSYRKLLVRCGSQWANEKGAATKARSDLKLIIDSCPICQKVRGLRERVKTKHSFIVSRPFLEVSYDFIIFSREDKNGNRYLIVAIDNFLKIVEIKAVKTRDAQTVATFLLELGSRYGPMARLRSDLEGAFTGLLINRLNEVRGTEEVKCIAYHPQANSICERQNGIIMTHLNSLILGCKLGTESKVGWSDLIPFVFSLVNNTPKNPLGISPLAMLYGVFGNYDQPLLPNNRANTLGTTSNPSDYIDNLIAWQTELLDITEQIQSDHFAKMEKRFNEPTAITRVFNEGDFVLQWKHATGISGKPSTRWIGPFVVMNRKDNNPAHPVLELMNLTSMKVKEASIDDCRSFNTSWFDEENLLPELIKLAATDANEYMVEKIVNHKPLGDRGSKSLSKYMFEVKWCDFTETSWEPYSTLKNLQPLEEYAALHPNLKLIKKL